MINIIFSIFFYIAVGFVFYILLKRKCFFSLSVSGLYILYHLFIFAIVIFEESFFWGVFTTSMSLLFWSWLFLLFFVPALLFDFWRTKRINIQSDQSQPNKQRRIYLITTVVILVIVFCFIGYFKFFGIKNSEKIDEDYSTEETDNSSVKQNSPSKINPKDYSLTDYPLKESPIYSQLDDYCFDPKEEPWTVQQDTRIIKKENEIIIPSLRKFIFDANGEKPNCVTIIKTFSVPNDGNYLYLEIDKVSFKEHRSIPIYRLDLASLLVKKLNNISTDASKDVQIGGAFIGFIKNNNFLLPDGKRVIQWDENGVYLINMETDYKSVLYAVSQNQWLISSVDPEDVVGQFFNTDVKVEENQITIGIYDKNLSQDGKMVFDDGGINWKELDPNGERMIEPKFKFIKKVTVPIPDSQSQSFNRNFGDAGIIVDSPKSNQIISSPLKITGYIDDSFSGGWEADFGSVELVDNKGLKLASAQLRVDATDDEGNYKERPYYFESTLIFDEPQIETGALIFYEHTARGDVIEKFRLPVKFGKISGE